MGMRTHAHKIARKQIETLHVLPLVLLVLNIDTHCFKINAVINLTGHENPQNNSYISASYHKLTHAIKTNNNDNN